jgi:hypothetical protein
MTAQTRRQTLTTFNVCRQLASQRHLPSHPFRGILIYKREEVERTLAT